MKFLRTLVTLAAAAILPVMASAEGYPTRPITLVVPYAAGTGLDGLGRAIANTLSKSMGQPVVVENRPGAGSNLGVAQVARAKPDGYTLVIGANSAFAANVSLYKQLPFDPAADFAPVAFLGKGSMVVLATPKSGVTSMQELVSYAKKNPDKMNFGAGSVSARVWIELLKSMTDIKAETIVYNNGGVMLNNMLGGQLDFAIENTGTSRAMVASNKLRPLAVTSKTRGKFNAGVPTLTESGYGQYEVDTWYAVFAPKGTPPEIVQKLNAEINAAGKTEAVMRASDFMELLGAGGTTAELAAFQSAETAKWRVLVNKTKISLDE